MNEEIVVLLERNMDVLAALEHARDPGADPALLVLARALEEALARLALKEATGTNPGRRRKGVLPLVLR